MELFTLLPKYLTLIGNVLYNLKENDEAKYYAVQLSYSTFVTFQMCAPAVVVEAVNKQMENLRFKLHMRLMEEKDVEKHLELSSLLRFMEQKPLYSKAWRIIPEDINLIVALFSFITTYVIVIIQFLQIY
ncbi:uncharacterized protein LOC113234013 [Hyposmocoma kahamanoa]|uniref:uncharacterized protein LOC113234013 n=1 Tax=Hyposmocoma kahamanoa TaxID=1477025 RepID=UPI000E6D94DB|nr:uncharacterized protein LOC113234013 [Hyposmocoma kahamanoa]